MLSGNGRHRRPRQAPALVVAAGVTGSAIAIPLIGATGASAEEAPAWDRLAACESGGLWSAHMDNGFYGGLQLTQETWESYGGLEYAPRADLASRSQQIAVAEQVLADQGPAAWPTCAPIAGLDGSDGSDGSSSGAGETAKPSGEGEGSADSSGSEGSEDSSGDASKPSGEQKDPSATPDASETGDSGESGEPSDTADPSASPEATEATDGAEDAEGSRGANDSEKAEPGKNGDSSDGSGDSGSSGGSDGSDDRSSGKPSDSFGDGSWVTEPDNSGQNATPSPEGGDTATPSPSESAEPGKGRHRGDEAREGDEDGRGAGSGRHASRGGDSSRDGDDGSYTVRVGDSLWAIADGQHVEGGWSAIYDLNKDVVGSDPDLILPGQSLDLGEK
ncbi:LysM peptidoglycan-binding domain-containing protein [Streptomyces triticagri]|uniref:LysM peptidoglycan-binding domain-containing protein n=1 Tax=Streptomyces triticagri TaxID=2293568 RepID=A0A372MAB3_9ACTN|nr:transglycosylase family protein [Streptomyces triticagri]RFU87882.1 LysM peptidoglycan-binding domain-containing protein [Streptomyces triticagri]